MPKSSTQPTLNEGELLHALSQLNLFYPDESMWFPTWTKKARVDFFDVPIPIEANYYKRSIGMSKRPLMILSEQSLARLYHCLFTANAKLDAPAKDLEKEERLLFDSEDTTRPGGGG